MSILVFLSCFKVRNGLTVFTLLLCFIQLSTSIFIFTKQLSVTPTISPLMNAQARANLLTLADNFWPRLYNGSAVKASIELCTQGTSWVSVSRYNQNILCDPA